MTDLHICTRCLNLLKKEKHIHFKVHNYKNKHPCPLCAEPNPKHFISFENQLLPLILKKTQYVNARSLAIIDKLNDSLDTFELKFNAMLPAFGKHFAKHFFSSLNAEYAQMVELKRQQHLQKTKNLNKQNPQ